MSEFEYLIETVNRAAFIAEPFPHLETNNFLRDDHMRTVLADEQVHFAPVATDDDLHSKLVEHGYEIIRFPGSFNNWQEYTRHMQSTEPYDDDRNQPVAGRGLTYRLGQPRHRLIADLLMFMNQEEFKTALEKKFDIAEETTIISAIQKNLNGYEISPHPDSKQKALTYLININGPNFPEGDQLHTHLLEFKEKYQQVSEFWQSNEQVNRCWVPWNWCVTRKTTSTNNTFVAFHPVSNPPRLHAVKLEYDHKHSQRTVIYGNLMYAQPLELETRDWQSIEKTWL